MKKAEIFPARNLDWRQDDPIKFLPQRQIKTPFVHSLKEIKCGVCARVQHTKEASIKLRWKGRAAYAFSANAIKHILASSFLHCIPTRWDIYYEHCRTNVYNGEHNKRTIETRPLTTHYTYDEMMLRVYGMRMFPQDHCFHCNGPLPGPKHSCIQFTYHDDDVCLMPNANQICNLTWAHLLYGCAAVVPLHLLQLTITI